MAWLPDRSVSGPLQAGPQDIEPLNRIFADAFTDRYRRDGLAGVRVPFLNPLIWRYAIEDAGEGAMLWRDASGRLIAFNMVHQSGVEGWMGPLAVRPDRQNEGLGQEIVMAGVEWLRERGVRTIGLETMPRTVENIGFYSRLGFEPGPLTVTLIRDVARRAVRKEGAPPAPPTVAECRDLAVRVTGGVDFSREIELTRELRIGNVTGIRREARLAAFGLWHSASLAESRTADELRVLKVVAVDVEAFAALVDELVRTATRERMRRLSLRCQTQDPAPYARLIADGFRVHWTDLRMTVRGYGERPVKPGVVLSNWEI